MSQVPAACSLGEEQLARPSVHTGQMGGALSASQAVGSGDRISSEGRLCKEEDSDRNTE